MRSETSLADLGRGYGWWGDQQWERGQFKEALDSYLRSLDYRRQAFLEHQGSPADRLQLARGHANFAKMYAGAGQVADALRIYKTSLEIVGVVNADNANQERLLEANLLPSDFEGDAAWYRMHIARMHLARGDVNDAVEQAAMALKIYERIADRDPHVRQYRLGLARAQTQLAIAVTQGKAAGLASRHDPIALLRAAVETFENSAPDSRPLVEPDRVRALATLGHIQFKAGMDAGLPRLKEAVSMTKLESQELRELQFLDLTVSTLMRCAAAMSSEGDSASELTDRVDDLTARRQTLVNDLRQALRTRELKLEAIIKFRRP
jgi:tetratricopeptide (TPR) repeat protein